MIFDRKKIHSRFYKESIKKFSAYDVRSLQWNSKESQLKRFLSLKRIGNLNSSKILDIGCGTGDFLAYLLGNGFQVDRYFGIDLMNEFIEVAQEKYPYPNIEFINEDFFTYTINEHFDFGICNGAINVKEKDNMQLLKKVIIKSLPLIKKSLGITLLKYSPLYFEDKELFHYNEKSVFNMLEEKNLDFKIFSDYADNDFTVFIYK